LRRESPEEDGTEGRGVKENGTDGAAIEVGALR
jgi:hypothetical protein